jgi:hypothetical protein
MFKKRFLLGLATSSILLVSLTISSFTIQASPLHQGTTGSFYRQQVSSNSYHLDCFRRYYNFNHDQDSTRNQQDASNYYLNLS